MSEGGPRWKGIILAGGAGTRLFPATRVVSKQLLPIYDKPLVYYPLTTLMLADIRDILIITTPRDQAAFQTLLGDGRQWGLNLGYAAQPRPDGIGQAFVIGASFIGTDNVVLVLGDNIFFGHALRSDLKEARARRHGATIFGYRVADPERYGVVEFDQAGRVVGLEEKPRQPRSNYAVTGLYFFDNRVVEMAAAAARSARGEYEITDLNRAFLDRGELWIKRMGRGYAWFDAGTHGSLLEASQFVYTIQRRQGFQIACPEEVAYRLGYIDGEQVQTLAQGFGNTEYASYLRQIPAESGPRDWAAVYDSGEPPWVRPSRSPL